MSCAACGTYWSSVEVNNGDLVSGGTRHKLLSIGNGGDQRLRASVRSSIVCSPRALVPASQHAHAQPTNNQQCENDNNSAHCRNLSHVSKQNEHNSNFSLTVIVCKLNAI